MSKIKNTRNAAPRSATGSPQDPHLASVTAPVPGGTPDSAGGDREPERTNAVEVDRSGPEETITGYRPFWMVGPEPHWCTFGHFEDDRLADRRHVGSSRVMQLSLQDLCDRSAHTAEKRWDPARLRINLVQRLTEVEPAILLHRDPESDEPWVTIRLNEADDLATKLIAAAEQSEETLPTQPAPESSPFWLTTACPPWCEESHDANAHYVDRVHMASLSEEAMIRVDLLLERSTHGSAEWLEISVIRHYRESTATISLNKTDQVGVNLTPAEARALAQHLRHLIRAGQASPASSENRHDGDNRPTSPGPATNNLGEPLYPCPRQIPWCEGHAKFEIKEARDPDNGLLHHSVVGSATFTMAGKPGLVEVAIEHDDDPRRAPFAYVTISGGDGGAELEPTAIDELTAVLARARVALTSYTGAAKSATAQDHHAGDEEQHHSHADGPVPQPAYAS